MNAIVDLHSSDVSSTEQRNYKYYFQSCCVLQGHYDDEREKILFHKTTSERQDQDPDRSVQDQDQDHSYQDQDQFFWSCPKTDGLRPHLCRKIQIAGRSSSVPVTLKGGV